MLLETKHVLYVCLFFLMPLVIKLKDFCLNLKYPPDESHDHHGRLDDSDSAKRHLNDDDFKKQDDEEQLSWRQRVFCCCNRKQETIEEDDEPQELT